jgi:excisionase family DNA binding protein
MTMETITIADLLNSGANITVAINLEQLKVWHKEVIEDTIRKCEDVVLSAKAETYPSPKQVSELLNVHLTTLWRWAAKGYLVPLEVGRKRRYKMSEVKALMEGGSV